MSILKRTRSVLSVLAAVGLALGVSSGIQAQEQQPTSRDEAQLSQDKLQEALAEPDRQLSELQKMTGLATDQITIVELSQIVPDEATIEQLRQENRTAITQFQTELREHEAVSQALEAEGRAVEDVFALYVPDTGVEKEEMAHEERPAEEQPSEEQPEQARDPSTQHKAGNVYVIVSGSSAGAMPSDSLR